VATTAATPRARRVHPATAVLGVLVAGTAILLMYAGRHLTFFFDEWDFILGRRGTSIGTFLDPHNGHLSLFPVIFYKVCLQLFGLRHYWPYRAAVVGLDLISGALLYVLAARRLDRWLALVPAALLMLLGSAYQDLLWPFQVGFLGSAATGLGALVLLDRPAGRGADVGACLLLIVSVGSSGIGLAFLGAAAVMLLGQRSVLRRYWLIAVPAVLFAIWYVGWGGGQHVTADSVLGSPQYVASAASAAFAGIAGLDVSFGPALTVAAVAVIVIVVARQDLIGRPLLLAALAGALIFWGLSSVARATEADPQASRYVYIGAVFVLLVAIEAAARVQPSRAIMAVLAVLTVAAIAANSGQLRTGERGMRTADDSVRVSLAAVDIAAPVVSPAFQVNTEAAPQIFAGPYLAAARDFGSPALTPAELEHAPTSAQMTADSTLLEAERIAAVPGSSTPCRDAGAATAGLSVAPGHVLTVTAGAQPAVLLVSRFASTASSTALTHLAPHRTYAVSFPRDDAPTIPWNVSAAGTAMCVS
jgi:hypothetical protein